MTDRFFAARSGADQAETPAATVRRRIMRFMRQMHCETDETSLVKAAIDRAWLDADGAPTPEGERLVRAFNDLDRLSASYSAPY